MEISKIEQDCHEGYYTQLRSTYLDLRQPPIQLGNAEFPFISKVRNIFVPQGLAPMFKRRPKLNPDFTTNPGYMRMALADNFGKMLNLNWPDRYELVTQSYVGRSGHEIVDLPKHMVDYITALAEMVDLGEIDDRFPEVVRRICVRTLGANTLPDNLRDRVLANRSSITDPAFLLWNMELHKTQNQDLRINRTSLWEYSIYNPQANLRFLGKDNDTIESIVNDPFSDKPNLPDSDRVMVVAARSFAREMWRLFDSISLPEEMIDQVASCSYSENFWKVFFNTKNFLDDTERTSLPKVLITTGEIRTYNSTYDASLTANVMDRLKQITSKYDVDLKIVDPRILKNPLNLKILTD